MPRPPGCRFFSLGYLPSKLLRMISDEGCMEHALSRMKSKAFGLATADFQNREGRFPAADDGERMRGGLLDDLLDTAIAIDEHHIEGNVGVLHPHAHRLRAFVHKQHAAHLRQRPHEHEPLSLASG